MECESINSKGEELQIHLSGFQEDTSQYYCCISDQGVGMSQETN